MALTEGEISIINELKQIKKLLKKSNEMEIFKETAKTEYSGKEYDDKLKEIESKEDTPI